MVPDPLATRLVARCMLEQTTQTLNEPLRHDRLCRLYVRPCTHLLCAIAHDFSAVGCAAWCRQKAMAEIRLAHKSEQKLEPQVSQALRQWAATMPAAFDDDPSVDADASLVMFDALSKADLWILAQVAVDAAAHTRAEGERTGTPQPAGVTAALLAHSPTKYAANYTFQVDELRTKLQAIRHPLTVLLAMAKTSEEWRNIVVDQMAGDEFALAGACLHAIWSADVMGRPRYLGGLDAAHRLAAAHPDSTWRPVLHRFAAKTAALAPDRFEVFLGFLLWQNRHFGMPFGALVHSVMATRGVLTSACAQPYRNERNERVYAVMTTSESLLSSVRKWAAATEALSAVLRGYVLREHLQPRRCLSTMRADVVAAVLTRVAHGQWDTADLVMEMGGTS